MKPAIDLHQTAREIFEAALRSVDAGAAVRRVVRCENSRVSFIENNLGKISFDLNALQQKVYAIAFGKAAHPMAAALDQILKDKLTAGVISCAVPPTLERPERWRVFAGGHPLPNEDSLNAARASFELLERAEAERALVIFLISGGGSAMIEWPCEERITLAELREANETLVGCGATIAEINAVRRGISAVKGGGLAARATHAAQVSLIISDTNAGEESNVASGPTFEPPHNAPDVQSVITSYLLAARLPASILLALKNFQPAKIENSPRAIREHLVLLDNNSALEAAANKARERGFTVEIARDLVEQPVAEGCAQLVSRLLELYKRCGGEGRGVCLISGGEFVCPVKGAGVGGRNAETALRCAIEMETQLRQQGASKPLHLAMLSAGTDGIDGNSPAAGAVADDMTLMRAHALGLDARGALIESDAYSFFNALGDALTIGPTGTNVRDLRIMLAY